MEIITRRRLPSLPANAGGPPLVYTCRARRVLISPFRGEATVPACGNGTRASAFYRALRDENPRPCARFERSLVRTPVRPRAQFRRVTAVSSNRVYARGTMPGCLPRFSLVPLPSTRLWHIGSRDGPVLDVRRVRGLSACHPNLGTALGIYHRTHPFSSTTLRFPAMKERRLCRRAALLLVLLLLWGACGELAELEHVVGVLAVVHVIVGGGHALKELLGLDLARHATAGCGCHGSRTSLGSGSLATTRAAHHGVTNHGARHGAHHRGSHGAHEGRALRSRLGSHGRGCCAQQQQDT